MGIWPQGVNIFYVTILPGMKPQPDRLVAIPGKQGVAISNQFEIQIIGGYLPFIGKEIESEFIVIAVK
jgi:hypothetical protein